MITAALTGNIGMGKSHVLKLFSELGAFTIDSDMIVAGLLARKDVLENIRFVLGRGVFDKQGGLDKKKVAALIFSDEAMRKAYEGLIHPLVAAEVDALLMTSGAKVAVVEIPLLFEGGFQSRFHRTITVYTDEATAVDRLEMAGHAKDETARRLSCQMPISEKVSRSDFTIDNTAGPDDVIPKVRQIYRALLAEAGG